MISTRYLLTGLLALTTYLISVMGIGRYSCSCSDSPSFALFGYKHKCPTQQHIEHHSHAEHKCICGAKLEPPKKSQEKSDPIKFFFLKADQLVGESVVFILVQLGDFHIAPKPYLESYYGFDRPFIKKFQALFRPIKIPLFKEYSQYLL